MKQNILVFGLITSLWTAGCGGPTEVRSPSLSAVIPNVAFSGRTLEVRLSGDQTAWTESPHVDFGPDIAVNTVAVSSPTSLTVNITLSPNVALGLRKVSVTQGAASIAYDGFRVTSPLAASLGNTVQQGSITRMAFRNVDLSRELSSAVDENDVFVNLKVEVEPSEGISHQILHVSSHAVELMLWVDVFAVPGERKLTLLNGPEGAQAPFVSSFTVVEKRPVEQLIPGVAATGTTPNWGESKLFGFTTAQGRSVVELKATSTAPERGPLMYLLDDSGQFAKTVSFGGEIIFWTEAPVRFYLAYTDRAEVPGTDYTVIMRQTAFAAHPEREPNNSKTGAGFPVSLPYGITAASLSSAEDEDWFAVDVPASAVGRKIHVQTLPGDQETGLRVDLILPDGETSLGEPSEGAYPHQGFTSAAIPAAGTYYLRFFASDFYDEDAGKAYVAFFRFE